MSLPPIHKFSSQFICTLSTSQLATSQGTTNAEPARDTAIQGVWNYEREPSYCVIFGAMFDMLHMSK